MSRRKMRRGWERSRWRMAQSTMAMKLSRGGEGSLYWMSHREGGGNGGKRTEVRAAMQIGSSERIETSSASGSVERRSISIWLGSGRWESIGVVAMAATKVDRGMPEERSEKSAKSQNLGFISRTVRLRFRHRRSQWRLERERRKSRVESICFDWEEDEAADLIHGERKTIDVQRALGWNN